jgi:hypothetical protein
MKKLLPEPAPLMTIHELAALMLSRFDEQNKKFVSLENRMSDGFAQQEDKMVSLEKKMDQRFADQDKKWEARLDQRFLEQDKKWDERFESLAMMVARGFEDQTTKLEEFKQETAKNFEAVDKKFEAVDEQFVVVRRDIINIGDAHRVIALETARPKKK